MAYNPVVGVQILEVGSVLSAEDDCAMLALNRQEIPKRDENKRTIFWPHQHKLAIRRRSRWKERAKDLFLEYGKFTVPKCGSAFHHAKGDANIANPPV